MTRYKYNKINLFIGSIFSMFGVIFTIVIITTILSWGEFSKTAMQTDAIITDITTTVERRHSGKTKRYHHVYVEYQVDGVTYDNKLDYYIGGMHEGQTVTINYDPEHPDRIMSKPYTMSIIMTVFVLIFGGIGAALLVTEIKRGIYINKLIANDCYVYCSNWTEQTSSTKVNDVRYMLAVFTYEDGSGRKYSFNSNPYHPNKCPFYKGQSVKVYVDLNNGDKYYVSPDE